jgi:hypothetical protein
MGRRRARRERRRGSTRAAGPLAGMGGKRFWSEEWDAVRMWTVLRWGERKRKEVVERLDYEGCAAHSKYEKMRCTLEYEGGRCILEYERCTAH